MSCVTCHLSHCYFNYFSSDKVVKLVDKGPVINGATPFSFRCVTVQVQWGGNVGGGGWWAKGQLLTIFGSMLYGWLMVNSCRVFVSEPPNSHIMLDGLFILNQWLFFWSQTQVCKLLDFLIDQYNQEKAALVAGVRSHLFAYNCICVRSRDIISPSDGTLYINPFKIHFFFTCVSLPLIWSSQDLCDAGKNKSESSGSALVKYHTRI